MANDPAEDRIRWHLEDMLAYSREAIAFHGGISRSELESDRKTQLAVIRCLEILGEAAKRIPASFQAQHPDIPWKEIISTRHRLIHGYDAISLDIVQVILTRELPDLIARLESLLPPDPKA